jgi:hypothetical protein
MRTTLAIRAEVQGTRRPRNIVQCVGFRRRVKQKDRWAKSDLDANRLIARLLKLIGVGCATLAWHFVDRGDPDTEHFLVNA